MNESRYEGADPWERIQRLEKEMRFLKVIGVLLFVGAIAASRYLPGKKTIEGQYLMLRDENGKQRVLITANTFAASLNLFGANEKLQAAISTEGDNPKLTIFDTNEKRRIAIGMMDEGPTLILENAAEKPALMILEREGVAAYALLDADGNLTWSAPPVDAAVLQERGR